MSRGKQKKRKKMRKKTKGSETSTLTITSWLEQMVARGIEAEDIKEKEDKRRCHEVWKMFKNHYTHTRTYADAYLQVYSIRVCTCQQ